MTTRKRLWISITHHGFGHLAQLSAWLNAPCTTQRFEILLQTSLPPTVVRSVISAPHKHIQQASDPGMRMHDALQVDPQATYASYLHRFKNKNHCLLTQRSLLERAKPDLVLSNAAWTPLLAAQASGIPNFALSSLNWSDLFIHYCGHYPMAQAIHHWIEQAYAQSHGFIKLTPGMAMPHLPGPQLGFTARQGKGATLTRTKKSAQRWVLVSPGGMPLDLSLSSWPVCQHIQWVFTTPSTPADRKDMHTPQSLGRHFIDLMASVDAVITKPGYGMFTEDALHGCPVLFMRRPDWPEQAPLIDWLQKHVPCTGVDWRTFQNHQWLPHLNALLAQPKQPPSRLAARQAAAKTTLAELTNIINSAC